MALLPMEAKNEQIKSFNFSDTTNTNGNATTLTGFDKDIRNTEIVGVAMITPQNCAAFPYQLSGDYDWRLKITQVSNDVLTVLKSTAVTGIIYYYDK